MKPILLCLGTLALLQGDSAHRGLPELIKGRFIDDYAIPHVITDSSWSIGARDRYRIVSSRDSAQFIIARNDSGNASDPGKWSRIDWIRLPEMAPYEWAFCLIEYQADTQAEAEKNETADGEHPRTGCNGFPFSRMRRAVGDSAIGRY
jgi:hypothetical protein